MSPNLSTVLTAAESLSVAEQCELVDLLLERLDSPSLAEAGDEPAVLNDAWRQEIARRSAEYDAGKAETVTWQEVRTRWQLRRAAGG